MARGVLWRGVSDVHSTYAPSPDGAGVLFDEDRGTTAHIVLLGAGHRVVTNIGDVPDPGRQGQITFNAMTQNYAAFVYSPANGDQASFLWQMWVWDRRAHTLTEVAHNPVDTHGHALSGGWVTPVLAGDVLYWIQATADTTGWGGSELVRYSLTDHTSKVVYRGLVTAFAPYGASVVLTALPPGTAPPDAKTQADPPPLATLLLDPATAKLSAGPAGLTAGADQPNTIISDGDLVLWSTDQVVRAWRKSWGRSITLIPRTFEWPDGGKLGLSGPSYVRLYGHFVVWNPGANYVFDLMTNSFAQLQPHPGGDDMSALQF